MLPAAPSSRQDRDPLVPFRSTPAITVRIPARVSFPLPILNLFFRRARRFSSSCLSFCVPARASALSLYPPIRSVSFFKLSYLPRRPRFLPDFANPSVSKNRASEYTRGSIVLFPTATSFPALAAPPQPPFAALFIFRLRVTSFLLTPPFPTMSLFRN